LLLKETALAVKPFFLWNPGAALAVFEASAKVFAPQLHPTSLDRSGRVWSKTEVESSIGLYIALRNSFESFLCVFVLPSLHSSVHTLLSRAFDRAHLIFQNGDPISPS
jgi:hypothetical protein